MEMIDPFIDFLHMLMGTPLFYPLVTLLLSLIHI